MLPPPPVDQSASAAVNKPLVAPSHNEASATLSPLGSAPGTVSPAQLLRDRNTSYEITGLGLERLAGSSELDSTRPSDRPSPHFPFPRQLSGRSFASCSKLFANSVSLHPFDFRSDKNCMTLLAGFAPSGDACSSPSSWCRCLPAGSPLPGHRLGGLRLLAVSLR